MTRISNQVHLGLLSLLTVGVAPLAYAAPDGPGQPLVVQYDCSKVKPALALPERGLRLQLEDATSSPAEKNLNKLGPLACAAAAAAIREANYEKQDMPWIDGLPVVLRDQVLGSTDQAFFKRVKPGNPPREMQIAVGMLQAYSPKQFLFLVGHELGHGVYSHFENKQHVRTASIYAGMAGVIAAGRAPGKVLKTAGAVTAAASTAAFFCGPGALNVRQEKQADVFAVHTMVEAGMTLQDAQAEAIRLVQAHQENEGSCLKSADGTYSLPDDGRHPGTADRVAALRAIAAWPN